LAKKLSKKSIGKTQQEMDFLAALLQEIATQRRSEGRVLLYLKDSLK
jgi:hypothetical protein